MSDGPEESARPKLKQFRKPFTTVKLSAEGAERQSRVTLLAWNRLGADQALAFLNAEDAALGGRPLNLAVASEAGCEAVARAIETRAVGERD